MAHYKQPKHLWRDILFIILGMFVGYLIYINQHYFNFSITHPVAGVIASLIAGIFFTSAFTIAPAGVILAGLMQHFPVLEVAILGSLGAVFGDLIIFMFIRDNISEDLTYLVRIARPRRYRHLIKFPFIRFITPLMGALLIASPLPDELGLAMMGLSKTRTSVLVPICFGMNFLGIVLIGAALRAL